MASLGVSLLNTNISHKEGIEAVLQKLKKSKPSISIKVILNFWKPLLTLNGINYLRKKGCAMGTECAPSYANIFIGWFEENLIFTSDKLNQFLSAFYRWDLSNLEWK